MSWGKKRLNGAKKKHSENLITRTKRNEPTIQAIWSPFSYIAQQQSIGVSAEKCSIRLIHASRYKKRTHTQFTQFKLHFQQFGILFYFILILFADATKLSSSFFLFVFRRLLFLAILLSLSFPFLFVWWFPIHVRLLCPFCMWDWIVFCIWNRKKWNNNDPMTLLVDCLKAAWEAKGIRVKLKSTKNEVKQRWEKSKIRQKQVSFSFWQQAPT